jgi:hypothetical protein
MEMELQAMIVSVDVPSVCMLCVVFESFVAFVVALLITGRAAIKVRIKESRRSGTLRLASAETIKVKSISSLRRLNVSNTETDLISDDDLKKGAGATHRQGSIENLLTSAID